MPILIKGGKVFTGGKLIDAHILIEKGKIKKISKRKLPADNIIKAKGKIILPGLIDCHVHMREPGMIAKENFYTGSEAAVAGGVTTVLDMPNTKPPTFTVQDMIKKRTLAEKSVVNYGFYMGTLGNNLDEIAKARNLAGVKVYMDKTTGKLMVTSDKKLLKIFNSHQLVAVHAEGATLNKAMAIMKKTNNRLYVCHVSTAKELSIISKYKRKFKGRLFCEVTPHHLFLTNKDVRRLKGYGMMRPALGSPVDQKALWRAVKSGLIDTVATDHAPHTLKEKKKSNPPMGVPGLETMLPLLLDAINKRKFTFKQLVKMTSENPAKIFNIKNKGMIKEGYDADLVIVDMKKIAEVKNKKLFTKCKWSPFNRMKLKGWPIYTFVNGILIFENGKINLTKNLARGEVHE